MIINPNFHVILTLVPYLLTLLIIIMDLNTLRTLHAIGNYPSIITELSSPATLSKNEINSEFLVLGWKSILKGTGDVSKCGQFLSTSTGQAVSELLKKSLMLWSKVYKNHINNQTGSSSDVMAFKELGLKAHEAVEIEADERDQIILISAEALLMLSATSESFSLLKLLKASNLDWYKNVRCYYPHSNLFLSIFSQVMFIEILINFGQFSLAQDRLQKMKNIPEWKDDVRFLLIEALLGLTSCDANESFGVMDSLYSYQELIQVHGSTPRLLLHLAAAFILLKKFTEAQSTLLQIPQSPETDSIVKANLLVIDSLLNSPNFPSSLS